MKPNRRKAVLEKLSLKKEIERFARVTSRDYELQVLIEINYTEPVSFKRLCKSFIIPKDELFLLKDTLKFLIKEEMIEYYKNKYQLTDLGAVSIRRIQDMIKSNESKSLLD